MLARFAGPWNHRLIVIFTLSCKKNTTVPPQWTMMHFLQSGWKTVPCVNIPALQNTRVRAGKRGGTNRRETVHGSCLFVYFYVMAFYSISASPPRAKRNHQSACYSVLCHILALVLTFKSTCMIVMTDRDKPETSWWVEGVEFEPQWLYSST